MLQQPPSCAFADAWDHPRYHVTTDVTLMAMIRVLGDYLRSARGPPDGLQRVWGSH